MRTLEGSAETLGCSCPKHPAPVIRAAASVHIIDIVFMYFYPVKRRGKRRPEKTVLSGISLA